MTINQTLEDKLNECYELFEEEAFEEALELTRQLLAQDDENHEIWSLEGKIRLALGEVQAAERSLDRACTLAPGHPDPLIHKAHFLVVMERFEEASLLCEQALEHTDDALDRFDAYFLQAQALIGIARRQLFELADQMGEEDLGGTLTPEIRESFERGLESARKAQRLHPEFPDLWNLIGGCLMDLERQSEAIDAFEQATRLLPENPDYWHDLAVAREITDDEDEARQAYREVYDLDTSIQEGMDFSRAEFEEMAQQAWQHLRREMEEEFAEELPNVTIRTEEFPPAELLEDEEELFDPRTPARVEIMAPEGLTSSDPPTQLDLLLTFYQRNTERMALTEEAEEMMAFFLHLIEEIFLTIAEAEPEDIEA